MLPGIDATPIETAIGIAIFIVANTVISEALVRRGRELVVGRPPIRGDARNQPGDRGHRARAGATTLTDERLEHALVFAGLLTLIITLYDRYRPIHVARSRRPPWLTTPRWPAVALVTGAGSGIGRATATRLAADGATVGCLDHDGQAAEAVADAIRGGGGRATGLIARRDRRGGGRRPSSDSRPAGGPVAVLVNNAGVPGAGRFVDISFEDWRRVLDVHVDGAFHVTKAVLPGMIDGGSGRIVNIASEAVWLGNQSVQYVTAKAALVGFTVRSPISSPPRASW